MAKTLLSPLAARRRFRHLLGTAAGLALLAVPAAAQAQTIFGLSGTDLTSANLASPTTTQTRVAITGVTAGQTLVGLDFRPATGQLFALGYDASTTGNNARLYVLDQSTAVATPVGASAIRLELGGSSERIAFDFNPTVDRIRVAGTNDNNYRLNPNNGALVTMDGPLAYVAGDPNAGQNPFIGTAAYTNSFIGAASTTLYYIDEQRSLLVRSDNPNGGSLATVVAINPTAQGNPTPINAPGASTDLDIYTVGPNDQQAYLSVNQVDGSGNFATLIYRLNLTTGATTFAGGMTGMGVGTTDIAVRIDRTAPAPSGRLLYAVSSNSNLLSFYSGTPGFINTSVAITGIASGQTLVGTDFRPNTGQLFGLGYNTSTGESRLYTIDLTTAVATPVGSGPITLALGDATDNIGFDFNPTVDRIRVVSTNRADFRLNPNNGALAATDGGLAYSTTSTPADPNAGQTPRIGAVGYTNSYPGSTGTTLYDIDEARSTLATQNPPNAGVLNTVGTLGGLSLSSTNALVDLDVYFDRTSLTNEAYLAANPNGQGTSNLYTLALGSGATTLVGAIGLGIPVRDISAQLAGADATAMLTGRLLYGVAGGNLVSFDSGNPTVIRTAVNITGLPADGSQVLVGADFRPLDGSLFALGYNASTQQGQLYSLNVGTGALTAVSALQALPLGTTASAIGFDFNPTVDRIRITSASTQANLRMSPADGTFTADVNLTNPDNANAPALAGVAYTNNDNNAGTGTMLYGYDQTANVLTLATVASGAPAGTNAANAGTFRNVGGSGLSVAPGVDFDIYSDLSNAASPANTGYLVAAPTGTTADNLYTINLGTGAASLVGRIGSGSNLTGLAAFLTPDVFSVTWNGSVSTDWFTAANWTPNVVPVANSNVTIPGGVANQPAIGAGTARARNLAINSGASLSQADGTLAVAADLTNNGALQLTGGTVALGSTALSNLLGSGNIRFWNLAVGASGAQQSTSASTSVRRLLTLDGSFATNGNSFTLESDASGTALVVNNTAGAVIAGAATFQRYLDPSQNPGLGYRHLSAPISTATVGSLATSSFTPVVNPSYNTSAQPGTVTPFPTVYGYDQARLATVNNNLDAFDKGWVSPTSLADALNVGQGYTVNLAAGQTLSFTGTQNDAGSQPITRSLTRNAAGTPNASAAGWQLVGNPFPSPLDYNNVAAADRTGLDPAIYVYESSGQYTGSYRASLNGVGGNTNSPNAVVAMGQGFFVRVSDGQTSGTLNFRNSQRITTYTNPSLLRTAETRPLVRLSLQGAGSKLIDHAYVYFEQGASTGYEAAFDAVKLPNPTGLNLSTSVAARQLAIDGQAALGTDQRVVALAVGVPAAGSYTLSASQLLNLTNVPVYLRDSQTGAVIDLAQQASYQFVVSDASALLTNRFELLFSPQQPLAAVPAALAQQVAVYPNPATSAVTIELPATLGRTAVAATLTDALGRQVRTVTLPAQGPAAHQLDLHQLAPGVYALRLTTGAGVLVKKLVVK